MALDIETYALAKKYTDTHGGGGGGTTDYNSLNNLPTMNGKPIQGNLTADDLDLVGGVTVVDDTLVIS